MYLCAFDSKFSVSTAVGGWFSFSPLHTLPTTSKKQLLSLLCPEGIKMLTPGLKLQYLSHQMWRADSLEKTLMLGKTEGRRRRGRQRMKWWIVSQTQRTWVWANSRRQWRTGKPGVLQSMESQRVRHDWATELIANNGRAACNNIFVNHNIFILILIPFPLSYKLKIKFIWAIIFIVSSK